MKWFGESLRTSLSNILALIHIYGLSIDFPQTGYNPWPPAGPLERNVLQSSLSFSRPSEVGRVLKMRGKIMKYPTGIYAKFYY